MQDEGTTTTTVIEEQGDVQEVTETTVTIENKTTGDVLVGHPTIGIGRNVAKDGLGISQEEAEFMLMNDIDRVKEEIKNFPIEHLNEVRTAIIIDMAFNMGITRFNPTMWKKTFQAIVNEDWQKATTEMLDSNWARQTKRRSARLSQMMLVGKWID